LRGNPEDFWSWSTGPRLVPLAWYRPRQEKISVWEMDFSRIIPTPAPVPWHIWEFTRNRTALKHLETLGLLGITSWNLIT
jgi:hypothetical protein